MSLPLQDIKVLDLSRVEIPHQSAARPPLLGQHTDEVLRRYLGLNRAAIDELRRSGAI